MVVTNDVTLPTCEELTVDEVNLSMTTLITAAPYVGKACEKVNNEFMLCRFETGDPRPCVKIGKSVTTCAFKVLKDIKRECLNEFKQYANCIDKSSGDYAYRHCRKTQAIFDGCMKDKLKMERPEFGYFCRARVHQTSMAQPIAPNCPCHPAVPDPTPKLPADAPKPPARFTSRYFWLTE